MNLKPLINSDCITVRQLKDWIKDLPEKNSYGQDFEVWMATGWCVSNPVVEILPLNQRDDGSDIIMECRQEIWMEKEE